MFAYYCRLALRSFSRNKALTALMVLAIGLGIGATMTTLTVFHVLSGNPIPHKSDRLFYPQIEPRSKAGFTPGEEPEWQMTRLDAETLLEQKRADRQALMTAGSVAIEPNKAGLAPFAASARFTTADFFPMFDVPMRAGRAWTAEEDRARARVVVISSGLADRLFERGDAVGRSLRIEQNDMRVIGVVDTWRLAPRFYDLSGESYGGDEEVLVPFWTSRELSLSPSGNMNCWGGDDDENSGPPDPEGNYGRSANCSWLQYWVELGSAAKVEAYRKYLVDYSEQQRAAGRFERPTNVRLHDVMGWLEVNGVVPDDVRLQNWLALGFLLVCLINTVGLLLAKFLRRASEIGVRRALGATRRAVFSQYLIEATAIGFAGGALGLALSQLGLWAVRQQPVNYAEFIAFDGRMLLAALGITLAASLLAGLLPAWRACMVPPAIQLKSQ